MQKYDAIVIGAGSMGIAACYWLAKNGCKVLALDKFGIPHEQGSHAGQTRIIRKSYFEHPGYVPLLKRAYGNWLTLEKETGTSLYVKTGLLYLASPNHFLMNGVKDSASFYNIEHRHLDRNQVESQFPGFMLAPGFEALYEPDAGFILPEKAIIIYKQEAEKAGAEIHTGEPVLEWTRGKEGLKVTTAKNIYHTRKLIIAAGAWSGKLIPELEKTLKVTRQLIVWVKPDDAELFTPDRCSCWMVADAKREGVLYGFPYLAKEKFGEPEGMKFAWHLPAAETNPDHVNREITKEEIKDLVQMVSQYIPAVGKAKVVAAKTCLYTNSPDENFIIDHLPGYDKDVTIACGFSGHGFKFVSVVGEILADLAMNGNTELPVDFLRLKRFQKA